MFSLILVVSILFAVGALWGIVVGEREAYMWLDRIPRRLFHFFVIDYHGNRMAEVFSIFGMMILTCGVDLFYFSKVFLVLALLAFMHIFYRASYNLSYYNYILVDRSKIDNVYKVFGCKIPHPSTKLLFIFYTIFDLVMACLIYLNEVNWNL